MGIFSELAIVLAITTLLAFGARLLRQPLIIAYILAGIVVGPVGLNILTAHSTVELFAKLGITILLFIVGLHLNPRVIKEVGSVSLITGLGQVFITSVVGFGIGIFLGLDFVAALYVAIALTFSSTIIILKLLSDKGDMQSIYGKIAIGFLLVQDLVATTILVFMASVSSSGDLPITQTLLNTFTSAAIFLSIILLLSKWVLPRITKFSSRQPELLFLTTLSWGLGLATLFHWSGLSIEIGALIAGVSLSATSYAEEIGSRLRPLRDFFIILFFVLLGSQVSLLGISQQLVPILILSAFVLIGNPIIVLVIMNLLGYHRKIGFMAGLTVAQISEFSLILAAIGFESGHLSQETVTIITLVGVVTISLSSYLILYAERVYPKVENLLKLLELRAVDGNMQYQSKKITAVLCGYHRSGPILYAALKKIGLRPMIIDLDPEVETRLPSKKTPYLYGDLNNSEFIGEIPLKHCKILISTTKEVSSNSLLAELASSKYPDVITIFFAETDTDEQVLYQAGATYVMRPQLETAHQLDKFLQRVGVNKESFERKATSASY